MKVSYLLVFSAAVLSLTLVSGPLYVAEAVDCNVIELLPCLPAITTPAPPTEECCAKLKEQEPCLCGYLKDPQYSKYISLPGAQKISTACGVPFPQCN